MIEQYPCIDEKLGGDIKRFRFMHRALGTEKRERNGEENSRQRENTGSIRQKN